jgi:hypothetical protein
MPAHLLYFPISFKPSLVTFGPLVQPVRVSMLILSHSLPFAFRFQAHPVIKCVALTIDFDRFRVSAGAEVGKTKNKIEKAKTNCIYIELKK